MAAKIRSYQPRCRILLRHELFIEGQLGDMGEISISKNLYAPVGEFTINFPDHPYHSGKSLLGGMNITQRRSLYDIINPLDPIEIELSRWREEDMTVTYTTVLRGFVRSIGRSESVDGEGRVQRQVVVEGHDCGAPFIMEQIGALISAMQTGVSIPPAFRYLTEFGLISTPMPLSTFIGELAIASTKPIMDTAGFSYEPLLYVKKGYCNPAFAFSSDGPVWEILKRYSDAPWNELFVREGEKNPELVFRPTPWKNAEGEWLPDVVVDDVTTWDIPMRNITALSAHRDDSEQVEHVFIQNSNIQISTNSIPLEKGVGDFNTELRTKFGDRIQVLQEHVGPALPEMNLPEEQQIQSNNDGYAWLMDRTEWMKAAGKDVYKFEKGTVTIKGDPRIRVGDYIHVKRGPLDWAGYVVSVQQSFQPYRRYLTTLEYIRSDQWIWRQQLGEDYPLWDAERRQQA